MLSFCLHLKAQTSLILFVLLTQIWVIWPGGRVVTDPWPSTTPRSTCPDYSHSCQRILIFIQTLLGPAPTAILWSRPEPWWLSGKELTCNAGDAGSIPGLGRSPGVGNGNPLPYPCLENPWTEEPGGLYSPWDRKRVGHDLTTKQQQSLAVLILEGVWPCNYKGPSQCQRWMKRRQGFFLVPRHITKFSSSSGR